MRHPWHSQRTVFGSHSRTTCVRLSIAMHPSAARHDRRLSRIVWPRPKRWDCRSIHFVRKAHITWRACDAILFAIVKWNFNVENKENSTEHVISVRICARFAHASTKWRPRGWDATRILGALGNLFYAFLYNVQAGIYLLTANRERRIRKYRLHSFRKRGVREWRCALQTGKGNFQSNSIVI